MKRIAAIVLPDLLCELVRRRTDVRGPLAVLVEEPGHSEASAVTSLIEAVDEEARSWGVMPGQRVVEASAIASHLCVQRVTRAHVDEALSVVAETALAFAPTVSVALSARAHEAWSFEGAADTVWLDVTGAAHLWGGEEALLQSLRARVEELGHQARLAVAGGPRIARALARYGAQPLFCEDGEFSAFALLPIEALPIEPGIVHFFMQLGLRTVDDLMRLPPAALAARLGPYAADVMSLLRGADDVVPIPYEAPPELHEEADFEDGVESVEPLLFVLRGMTSRIGSRLTGRGEACTRLEIMVVYDRSIARLRAKERGAPGGEAFELRARIDLPAPLSEPADLLRALRAKLEKITLQSPAKGLCLIASRIVRARRVQMDLSRDVAVDPDRLPVLLAELSAEIGAERVGVLEMRDAHRPEARSVLVPVEVAAKARKPAPVLSESAEPTRLLPSPVPIGRVQEGSEVVLDGKPYTVLQMRFEMRLSAVEWWTESPVSRDYARVWLLAKKEQDKNKNQNPRTVRNASAPAPQEAAGVDGAQICAEAWVFVDRTTGEAFLHGWSE